MSRQEQIRMGGIGNRKKQTWDISWRVERIWQLIRCGEKATFIRRAENMLHLVEWLRHSTTIWGKIAIFLKRNTPLVDISSILKLFSPQIAKRIMNTFHHNRNPSGYCNYTVVVAQKERKKFFLVFHNFLLTKNTEWNFKDQFTTSWLNVSLILENSVAVLILLVTFSTLKFNGFSADSLCKKYLI